MKRRFQSLFLFVTLFLSAGLLSAEPEKGTLEQEFFGFKLGRETNVSLFRLNQNKNQKFSEGSSETFPLSSVTKTVKKPFFKFDKVRVFFDEQCRAVAIALVGEMEEKEFRIAWKSFCSQFSLRERKSSNVLEEHVKDPETGQTGFTGRTIRYVSKTTTESVPEVRTITTTPVYKDAYSRRREIVGFETSETSYSSGSRTFTTTPVYGYEQERSRELVRYETTEKVTPSRSYTKTTYQIVIMDEKLFYPAKEYAEEKLAKKFFENL